MKNTRKILAWVLLLCMTFSLLPSFAAEARAETIGDSVVINPMDYGADPTGAVDSTEAIWAAFQAAKELEAQGKSVTVKFPKGEYHIYKDRAQTREYHTSNTNSIENPTKTIGILIEGHTNLTVDGSGSLFMMHGNMMALAVVHSENIVLKDFAWDFAVPTVTEMTVTASGSDYTEYYIPECFPYTISGNTLVWSSDLSPYTGRAYWTATGNHNTYAVVAHHPDDEMTRNFSTDISPFTNARSITDLGNNVIRITYSSKNGTQREHHKPGTVIALCGNAHRETAGAFTWESKNVLAEGVNVHFMHGFGWLIQMSEDVTYRNCNLMPRENSGHLTVSFADGLHASGAAGEIRIENCNFSNTHDDPINFHGTFTRVEQRIDNYTLKLAYIHNQQGGFPQFHVGDKVAFYTRDTLESSDNNALYEVAEVVSQPGENGNNLRTMVVRFTTQVPSFLSNTVSNGTPKYVAENVTYSPAVTIKGCTFKSVPTRGILCTTRNPVLIEGNTFLNMSMATIFLSNDSNDWYESGPIRDMIIRNNTFYIKTIGDTYWDYKSAVYIHPVTYGNGLPSYENPIHKNITIEGNTFHMSDDTVVKAESVENLTIRNNTILRTAPEFAITIGSSVSGSLSVGQTVSLTTAAEGTTIIGDNNKNLGDTSSRNYDNVFEFTACKNVIIEGNTYDDGMKNYAVYSNMPESYISNSDSEIRLVTSASMAADAPVSDLVYVSTNPDVVSVNAAGQITAIADGTADVYAYYVWNGTVVKSNALTFTVGSGSGSGTQPDTDAAVTLADTVVLTADNTTAQLTAPGADTTWTVTDFYTGAASSAAAVSNGTVTAVSSGIVWVTATSGETVVKTPVVVSLAGQISQLNSGFEILKPDTANYSLSADGLVITQKGGNDLWTYDNTLENLFLYDNFDKSDLRTVVKIDGLPVRANNNWDTASFLLFAGYDDYVSVGKKGHKNGFATVVEQAQACSEFEESSTTNNNVTSAYVGFTVRNGSISMDYSLDNGATWTAVKTANASVLGDSYKIGFAAWGVGRNKVTFSQFRVGKASEVSYEQLMQQPVIPMLRTANQAPAASGVTFGASTYQVGQKAAVTFNFSDPDGDTQGNCLYLWSYTQDGSTHTAVTNVPEFNIPASGQLTCAVYPVDSLGMPGAPAKATVSVSAASGSADLGLSSLAVNGTSFDLDGGAVSFELLIPADLNKVEIQYQSLIGSAGSTTVAAGSNSQNVDNNGRISLDITGADTVIITRSAEGQTDKVYTVRLNRVESNATAIQGIQIPELSFSTTNLAAGTWTYRTTNSSATLKVLCDDSIGHVEVRYNNYRAPITMTRTSDGYQGTIDFVNGLNAFYIVVVAKDGITTKQYNVNVVYTPDTTSELKDVKINGVSLEDFASNRYEYMVDLTGMDSLTVEAVTDQKVRIRIADEYILEDSGEKTLSLEELKGGNFKVYIVTVADDGIVRKVYTLDMVAFENKDVTLKVGESATFTDESGYYVDADTSDLDTSVATVVITGTPTVTDKQLSAKVSSLTSGKKYIIVNTRANKPVTNAPASAAADAGAGSGLSLNGSKEDMADAAIWTVTASGNGYTLQANNGEYMTIGANTANLTTSAEQLTLTYNGSTWTIAQNGAYLNHFGGQNSTCAAGWEDPSAAGDSGSQWAIYEVLDVIVDGTSQLTFTGVGVGETSVRIGYTVYNIKVLEEAHEHKFDQENTDAKYLATPATCDKPATYYYSCACGEKDTTRTFESGEALGHDYGEPEFVWAEDNTAKAVFTCERDENHTHEETATVASETNTGDCKTKATTTYTATVTFEGATYTDIKTVEGDFGEHNWVEKDDEQYLKSNADCENAAVYYKSCSVCGEAHETDTFTSGEALGHDYGEPEFVWADANTAKAVFTCERDEKHTHEEKATVTSKTTEGDCETGATVVYTATVIFEDETYTDTKTVTTEAGGHSWMEKVDEQYLKSKADCENAAVYYKSCSVCGEAHKTETFTYGEALDHDWTEATCTAPKTCKRCNATEGEALGHDWTEATCTAPKTCKRCDATEGEALGHDWTEATCTDPKTCKRCDTTEGKALGHDWTDATCTAPKTCKKCNTTEGEALGHADADKNHKCDRCDTELTKCADVDPEDHKCDLCGAELSQCADADKNHKCDVCGKVLTECIDENKDYKCDICGAVLEKPEEPVIEDVIRLAGANRWETALKVADEMKANLDIEKFNSIIIASGNDFADALAGSYLSTVKNAPILLGWGKGGKYVTLDEANIAYIKANLAENGTVYILGGVNAVPELYENELKGFKVVRLGGANRFETNLLILEEAGVAEGSEILVCTSTNFADSLSASATAKPILLVFNESGKLYGKQPEFLSNLKNCTFTVIGGENAVSAKLFDAIKAYGTTTRLAGANRFETSVLVAQKYFKNVDTAVLAYAWNYPDGLCGGSLAFSLKAPLILTMTKYEAKAVEYAKNAGIKVGLVLGGDTLISDDAVRSIFAMDAADGIVKK